MKNNFKKKKAYLLQNSKSKKSLSDYTFHIGFVKQALHYAATMRFIINHIKKMHSSRNDIAKTIQTLIRSHFNK